RTRRGAPSEADRWRTPRASSSRARDRNPSHRSSVTTRGIIARRPEGPESLPGAVEDAVELEPVHPELLAEGVLVLLSEIEATEHCAVTFCGEGLEHPGDLPGVVVPFQLLGRGRRGRWRAVQPSLVLGDVPPRLPEVLDGEVAGQPR